MISVYPNLPGFRTNIQEGNLHVESTPMSGQRVVILGTATDGPVGTPVAINRPEEAEATFGRAVDEKGKPNGATLLPKFYEAYYGGARNIALMRVTGETARNSLVAEDKTTLVVHEERESLGLARGNSEMVFGELDLELSDKLTAVTVISNGSELPNSAYTFDEQSITLLENQTDSGADIALDLSFIREEERVFPREALRPLDTTYKAFVAPLGQAKWQEEEFKLWLNGEEVTEDLELEFTVNYEAGSIAFEEALESGDVVEASFKFREDVILNDFIAGLTALGAPQEIILNHKPVLSSVRFFAGGYELARESYLVDTANKKITLLPGFAPNKATLTVFYSYESEGTIYPSIRLNAITAGSIYNKVLVKVESLTDSMNVVYGKKIVVIKPETKKDSEFEPPLEFSSIDFPTFGEIVDAMNNATNNNVIRAETNNPDENTEDLFTVNSLYLTGGKDGLKPSLVDLYDKLGGKYDSEGRILEYGAYHYLDNYNGDYYIVAGVYADDDGGSPNKKFADQLAQFLAVQTFRNNECRGGIAVRPPKDNTLPSIVARVNELVQDKIRGEFSYYMRNLRGEHMRDEDGRLVDIGRHLDLIAFPTVRLSNQVLGAYSGSGEGLYAGLLASLPSSSDSTNKTLPGALSVDFELSAALHDMLSEAGFVTFYWDPGRGVTVVNGVTAASPLSDYRSLPNIRIALEAAQRIRRISRKYEGEPYNLVNRNAHTTDIQADLDAMVEEGKLTDFTFTIHQSLRDRVLHNAVISMDIVPAFSLKKITLSISLRPSL